ncbi:MAG: hypothetical protein IKW06_03520 [Clostridia bacterium]|nr:hypothetical protein [Clostridia bacterium]
MKKAISCILILCMMLSFSGFVVAQEDETTNFVTLKIPFPDDLKDNDSWRTVARYQDSGRAIPLSDCYDGYVYAIVPYENKDRAIETFVPDDIPFVDANESAYEYHVMENLSRVGIILGNEKGEALPFANVSRAEAVTMVMRFLGISPMVEGELPFADVFRKD